MLKGLFSTFVSLKVDVLALFLQDSFRVDI